MIGFNKEKRSFHLSGKSYSYILFVDERGVLQNLYYGEKTCEKDIAFLISQTASDVSLCRDLRNHTEESARVECGAYARGDYREPTLMIRRRDGGKAGIFRYCDYEIKEGVPSLKGLPHVRGGGQTLCIRIQDECSGVEIYLNYTVWDDSDVLARNIEIQNASEDTVYLQKVFSFCLDLPDCNYRLLRLYGAWARERTPEICNLGHGVTRLESTRGASSHETHPFAALLSPDCTETQGKCYGVQLVYSGSFALTAERNSYGTVRLQGGVHDTDFCWELKSGEVFVSPQALIAYSGAGLGELSREYADFIREHIVNLAFAYKRRPIVLNNWEATYFNFNRDKLFAIIDEAAALGADTFVLDDGWFGTRNDEAGGLGDWVVNEKKLESGLNALIKRCKERGLQFGLWIEPEMVSPDSDLYRVHPDFAIHQNGVEPALWRGQLTLDFTREEVVDCVYEMIAKILREHDISYVKWDMNRCVTECYSAWLSPEREGEFMHRFILGVYQLAERLTGEFPQILFEGCAAGGGRFDAGMLYYFPQIWTSDDTDAYERAKIQWGTSYCYPLSSMSCHVSVCPNHQTGRTVPLETRGAIASIGAFGFELDPSKMTADEKAVCKRQIAAYREISDLILNGDLYRLSSPFDKNYFCVMVVNKQKSKAYIVGQQLRAVLYAAATYLPLTGLCENKNYSVRELNLSASGKTLANAGIKLPALGEYQGFIWHLEEI